VSHFRFVRLLHDHHLKLIFFQPLDVLQRFAMNEITFNLQFVRLQSVSFVCILLWLVHEFRYKSAYTVAQKF